MSKFVLKNQRVDNKSQRDCTEFRHVFASGFALASIWIVTSIVRAKNSVIMCYQLTKTVNVL